MKTLLVSFYAVATLVVLSSLPAAAQGTAPADGSTVTNTFPDTITNEVPVITNAVPVTTNVTPIVRPRAIPSGATMLNSFGGQWGGKYSVSGRTLRLPAPEATTRQKESWRRCLDFGMNQTRGNSDTLRYSIGLDAVKEQDNDLMRLRGRGNYGESEHVKDTENAEATFRYERLLRPKVYALGNLDWYTDSIADLQYRVTGILSPGLRLIRSETSLLNVELGAGYIEEKKSDIVDGYAAGRAAATVEHILNAHVLVWCTGEYLPKLEDPGIFFVNAEAGLASYITRDLSLNVCYQERYDSSPGDGKKSSDTILSTALSLNF